MASQASVPGVASGNLTCFNGGNACRVKPEPELFQLTIRSDIAEFSPFSCPIFLGHPEARGRCSQGERVLYGRDLCRSGGAGEEPGQNQKSELFVTQGHNGIDVHRSPSGKVSCGHCCGKQNGCGDAEAKRVSGTYA